MPVLLHACRTTFLRDTMKYTVIKVGDVTTATALSDRICTPHAMHIIKLPIS
jgi:hypothetical protein